MNKAGIVPDLIELGVKQEIQLRKQTIVITVTKNYYIVDVIAVKWNNHSGKVVCQYLKN